MLILGSQLSRGALYIVEQVPGFIQRFVHRLILFLTKLQQSGDVTSHLQFGHWPSFNVPFFENIYEISGYPEYYRRYPKEGKRLILFFEWRSNTAMSIPTNPIQELRYSDVMPER
jgi:hypothetical protein